MDDYDRAQELEDFYRNTALKNQRERQSKRTSTECVDCGESIDERRLKAVVTERCAECQGYYDQES